MIIIDTNILAELMRRDPEPRVMSWMERHATSTLFTTTVTQAEILCGVAPLPRGKRRSALEKAANQVFSEDFADRVLHFDSLAAQEFAALAAARRHRGRPLAQFDGQIAAIARSRGAAIATRNVQDFEHLGLDLFDPWQDRM